LCMAIERTLPTEGDTVLLYEGSSILTSRAASALIT
jgi:hypothetical protein